MVQQEFLLLLAIGYTALLFGVAYIGDKRSSLRRDRPRHAMVYSLALAIYCTSWTFYGAVGRATSDGWDYLPIYLGPACVFLFGTSVLRKIVDVSKLNNITSVADFIGARYGRHQIAPLVLTVIATVGIVPYIALQLKAVSFGFDVLVGPSASPVLGGSGTVVIASVMAVFAILFGTRELSATENHHGMVLAMAFESLVKLVAFIAVGVLALSVIWPPTSSLSPRLESFGPATTSTFSSPNFLTQTLLAGAAIICLPRQFHLAVVEYSSSADLKLARFVFPAYLLLVSLFVIPIVQAGRVTFGSAATSPDTFVLSLPLALEHHWLGLVAYVGGLSAATGMVIVETIAISTMISNEIVMPVLLRSGRLSTIDGTKFVRRVLKLVRRTTVVLIIGMAYGYYRLFAGQGTLAQIGLLSFAAVAQFAPGVVGGVLWKGGTYLGVTAGLIAGALVWAYTLLLPAMASDTPWRLLVQEGLFGVDWLRPQALFGLGGGDPLTHGVLWSLSLNIGLYVLVPFLRKPGLRDVLQAAAFLSPARPAAAATQPDPTSSATVGDLQELAQHFLGSRRAEELFGGHRRTDGAALAPSDPLSPGLARAVEHALSGFIGASSARLVMHTTLKGRNMRPEDVVRLLDGTSHTLLFTRELMRTALEHLPQGISVVDNELKLVAWNQRYVSLLEYPEDVVQLGTPIEDLIRFNANRGWLVTLDVERSISSRLVHMRAGTAHVHERRMPNGIVLEMRGNPLPGGGFVTSYSDVTTHRQSQLALQDYNTSLEQRVDERTAELLSLNAELARSQVELEKAHASKTRFLAAASHDLAQPITAARMFVSSLDKAWKGTTSERNQTLLRRAEGALSAAEETLGSLLDFNRLEGGAERCKIEHIHLPPIIESLLNEFAPVARAKGLRIRQRNCDFTVMTDSHLLRRVLQNLISNAIRYTDSGGILVGCRRRGTWVAIQVLDTGRGISANHQEDIFQEYRQLVQGDQVPRQGLGLGLAIAKRIGDLLRHSISVQSVEGKGSKFEIAAPLGSRDQVAISVEATTEHLETFRGQIVCCIEDEPEVLAALCEMLSTWGCQARGYQTGGEALEAEFHEAKVPDVIVVDYNLADGQSGTEAAERLRELWDVRVPVVVLTAASVEAGELGEDSGTLRVVRKPLRPGSLRAVLDFVLR